MARKKKAEPAADPIRNSSSAGDELRQFVERYETLEADKKAVAEDQKQLMAEAKARGYDTKVLRRIIAERKRDADAIAEEEAILDLYRSVLGMGGYVLPDDDDDGDGDGGEDTDDTADDMV